LTHDEITAALAEHDISVKQVLGGKPGDDWASRTWVLCNAPWEQYDRSRSPGTYMDSFDGDVDAFVRRYRMRYMADAG
jgi:hypothetical protein